MDDKQQQQDDDGFRGRLAKIEEALRRLGGIYGGLRAIAAVAAVVFLFTLGGSDNDDQDRDPPGATATATVASLEEYCERSVRFAAAWVDFQSSASRGELRPGDLGPAVDNVWATHAAAPPELEDEYELLGTAVEELDEDLSGDALSDIGTFTALFVTNAPVLHAVDAIDAFDAENCSEAAG